MSNEHLAIQQKICWNKPKYALAQIRIKHAQAKWTMLKKVNWMKNVHKAGVRAPCTTRNGMPNEHMYGNAVFFRTVVLWSRKIHWIRCVALIKMQNCGQKKHGHLTLNHSRISNEKSIIVAIRFLCLLFFESDKFNGSIRKQKRTMHTHTFTFTCVLKHLLPAYTTQYCGQNNTFMCTFCVCWKWTREKNAKRKENNNPFMILSFKCALRISLRVSRSRNQLKPTTSDNKQRTRAIKWPT